MAQSLGQGFALAQNIKIAKQDRTDAKAEARQKQFQQTLTASKTAAMDNFKQIVEFAQKAASKGASQEQLEPLRQRAEAALIGYGSLVDEIKAQAVMSGGTAEDIAEIPNGESFVTRNLDIFDSAVFSGVAENPVNTGLNEADQQSAELVKTAQNLKSLGVEVSVEQLAQAAGITPGKEPLKEGLVDGSPAFVREGADGFETVQGATPIPSGLKLEIGPDGTIKLQSGEQLPQATSTTQTRIEKSILDSQDGLGRLRAIQASFDPRFLTIGGKIEGFLTSVKDKLSPESLTTEQKEFLEDYTVFTQDAIENLNRYIKEITGAQMSEPEAERLSKGIPNPEKDSPTQFKAKMDNSMRQLVLGRARAIHARKQGLDSLPWEIATLGDMESIIENRVKELEKTMDRTQAIDQVAKEFGL